MRLSVSVTSSLYYFVLEKDLLVRLRYAHFIYERNKTQKFSVI